ncbi:MAG: geranylgeranylglyceryl/heptaprenylglyceryl phosphate synthase [Desulfurococcales archaeon]|nr:geranylgeranylglyceryl/heptaprenylglyceryl phosphate synthase [Desulfurococcales archaeon]MCE4621798.1 geranylgeranylglyceryl/heptaprenylglyceryl phosphate synthase [Desulfurococcales archaeon]MCE4626508.1 geranylgeranylglyceryl/heptaprenylglyceryl phosphate synthase [Desulfurococcales archaeon]MCE4628896.1 geranylgeranylglyceryl/heptaprenylglyceryl phosphate synthase [Desulfurococcales archaeon]
MERLLERLKRLSEENRIHFTLIDPDKDDPEEAYRRASIARDAGTDVILIGGSTGVHEPTLSETVRRVKSLGLPVILFPGNLNGLTPEADAVFFMVLLNSMDPYYLTGVQVQAAPIVLRMGLEPIPTSYIIVGYGGAAGYIGRAKPIPYEHPELVAIHALAGAMMGSKVIYLEAGSGAPKPVPPEAVMYSKKLLQASGLDPILIVGGGVRDPETARALARAGANGLVTGTLAEEDPSKLAMVIEAFKNA